MKGHNSILSTEFSNSWKKRLGGYQEHQICGDIRLIGEDVSLKCVGVHLKRKGMMDYIKFKHKFFEEMEELVRMSFGNGYNRLSLPSPFGAIFYLLIKYFTLEDHYTTYHVYLFFFLLNMLRNGENVVIPFFLFSSPINSIVLGEIPHIHQGLIFFLYHCVFTHHSSFGRSLFLINFAKLLGIQSNNYVKAIAMWFEIKTLEDLEVDNIEFKGYLKLIIDMLLNKDNYPWSLL